MTIDVQRINEAVDQGPQAGEVGRSAVLMALGTLSSRVLGFLRDMMMAAYFSRTVTDAWLVAFRLPNLFRRLLGEGALSVSFVPVFVQLLSYRSAQERNSSLQDNKTSEAYKLTCTVFTVLLCLVIPIITLGVIYAEQVIQVLTPGREYTAIAGKVELTVKFSRIMFVFILFICLYALFMAILNSLKRFLLPAFAPALWNLSLIVSAFLPISGARESGEVLAWAVVIGGFLQMAILIPSLKREGFLPHLSFSWRSSYLASVLKGLGPSMIGLSIMQITILVNTRFASYLPEGTNSWIFWSDRILELPLSLFAVSLGTALLPTLSTQWHSGQRDSFHKTSSFYLRSVFVLSIPAAIGLWVLAGPIVEILFLRGRFTARDAEYTTAILQIYSLAVVVASGVRVLAPCFYAIKNTWYPALCSLVGLICHLLMAPILIERWSIQGLVSSTVGSAVINLLLLFYGYRYFIGPFDYIKFLKSFGTFTILGLLMGLCLRSYWFFLLLTGESICGKALSLVMATFIGSSVYFSIANLARLEEVAPTMQKIRKRICFSGNNN